MTLQSRPQPPKLFASDIASYDDLELDRYHGRIVGIEDPENLPEGFIQGLRVRGLASNIVSYPLDLNHISASLEQIHINSNRSPPTSTLPFVNEDPELRECMKYYTTEGDRPSQPISLGRDVSDNPGDHKILSHSQLMNHNAGGRVRKLWVDLELKEQTKYYNTLIREGGRPSHPVSLGRNILEYPGEYREILFYWQIRNHDAEGRVWKVFGSELSEWRRFREFQRTSRTKKRLDVYSRHLHRRLTRRGFMQSVQLHEDPEQQDRLTTWIEFLHFQYKIYGFYVGASKRLQPQADEAWKKLVVSEVLSPLETVNSIWNLSVIQQENEIQEAADAVGDAILAAQNAFREAKYAGPPGQTPPHIEAKLNAALSQLEATKSSLDQLRRRCGLIRDFKDQTRDHRRAEKAAKIHNILLRWIIKQVPLIESELNSAEAIDGSITMNGGRRGLKRNWANVLNEEKVSNIQRPDVEMIDENCYKRLRDV